MYKEFKRQWKKVRLSEIAKINVQSVGKNFSHAEIDYIDISSVGSGVLFETKKFQLAKAPSRAKRLVKNGDTILSTVRPNRRSFLYIKNPKENCVVSTGFVVLRPRGDINSRFLYYLVTNQSFTDYLVANVKGAAYPAVDTETISRAEVRVPSLPNQNKIATILSTYDNLIENNNYCIKILKEMARLIYKEWFVKFRFPGYEKVRMVESELGQIPEGWGVKSIFNITTVRYGKNLPGKKMKKDGNYLVYGAAKVIGKYNKYNCENATVITGCRGSCCQMKITKPKSFVTNNSFIFDFSEEQKLFFYHQLMIRGLQDYIGGTAQPQITLESISNLMIMLPKEELVKRFNQIGILIFNQIDLLDDINTNLHQTRDMLLPRLIKGEIDVSDLNIKLASEKI